VRHVWLRMSVIIGRWRCAYRGVPPFIIKGDVLSYVHLPLFIMGDACRMSRLSLLLVGNLTRYYKIFYQDVQKYYLT
jgi:hypothetical protein